jgi:hypothetical protein
VDDEEKGAWGSDVELDSDGKKVTKHQRCFCPSTLEEIFALAIFVPEACGIEL